MKSAVMIGTEDRILNPWAHMAKNYGFVPLFGDGSAKIQPVYVVDVASAIVSALKDDGTSMGKVYEHGGPDIYTMRQLAELMYEMIREYPKYVNVPFPIAKGMCSECAKVLRFQTLYPICRQPAAVQRQISLMEKKVDDAHYQVLRIQSF